MTLYEILREKLPGALLLENEPMAAHTTFKVGGRADVLLSVRSEEELKNAVLAARGIGCAVTFIGRGSNLLVRDGGIRGLVIRLGEEFGGIEVREDRIEARAGESLARLSNRAMEAGLSGLEFASGIPGSVGGAMAMNAGAYGGQMADVTERARVMDTATGEICEMELEQLSMGYRTSLVLEKGLLVTSALFRLKTGDRALIKAQMDELNRRRREKQPLNYPSAGSTFKRPEGYFAGALIEQAGLKGACVGGAQVSELHAGFIVNRGNATASDVLSLIGLVQQRVLENSGVTLETEVRIVGQDA